MAVTATHHLGNRERILVDQDAMPKNFSEFGWLTLLLVLFLLLGPFSAPIVLLALFRQGVEEPPVYEPKSIASF